MNHISWIKTHTITNRVLCPVEVILKRPPHQDRTSSDASLQVDTSHARKMIQVHNTLPVCPDYVHLEY